MNVAPVIIICALTALAMGSRAVAIDPRDPMGPPAWSSMDLLLEDSPPATGGPKPPQRRTRMEWTPPFRDGATFR
jgi:hypothetical protein